MAGPAGPGGIQPLNDVLQIQPLPPQISPSAGVGALQDVLTTQKKSIEATIDASGKNAQIATGLQTTNETLDNDTLDAYTNLTNILKHPVLSEVLSIFDQKYNPSLQQMRIETNALKAKQAAERAAAQISINNQAPAIANLQAQLAKDDFAFQKDLIDLGIKSRDLDQKEFGLRISAQELRMKMTDEQRKQADFALNSMTKAQAAQTLKEAQAGKGDWVGLEGLLEDKIDRSEKADLELENLRTSVPKNKLDVLKAQVDLKQSQFDAAVKAKKAPLEIAKLEQDLNQAQINFQQSQINLNQSAADTADKAALRLVKQFPNSVLSSELQKAVATGMPFITIRNINIPTHIVAQGVKENDDQEKLAGGIILANSNQQVQEKLNTVGASINSLSLMDPEARRLSATLAQASAAVNPADYNSVQSFNTLIDNIQGKAKDIAKRVASTAPTPEAKAAIEKFGTTGQFSPEDALSVTQAYAGAPYATKSTFYSDAFGVVNTEVARRASMQNLNGMPSFDGSETSTNAILAFIGRTGGIKKLDDIKHEVIADPTISSQVADRIGNKISQSVMEQAFARLAKGPVKIPIWNELSEHPERFQDQAGNWSLAKIAETLEQQSVVAGGNADYNKAFIAAMQRSAVDGSPGLDPQKSMLDKALEKTYIGPDPYRTALSDFISRITANAIAAHNEMKKRIDADVKGQTQLRAMQNTAVTSGALGSMGVQPSEDELRAAAAAAPSATGAPVSADRVRTLYGR